MIRGMNVFAPAVDDGVDLIAANGCRIQVKTAHLLSFASQKFTYPEGIYKFYFPHFKNVAMNGRESRRARRQSLKARCDMVVLWGIEENRFWVVPVDVMKDTQAIHVGPKKARAFEKDMPEIQAMLDMGISQSDIGERFGVSQATIWRRIQKAGTRRDCESIRFAVAQCEGAWEHILNFGSPEPVAPLDIPAQVREE